MLRFFVTSKVDFALKGTIAKSASKGFITGVLSHVGYEIGTLAEGFTADAAFVGFFT